MYEAAARDASGCGPLWRLTGERTLFVGTLDRNALHSHGAPVFLSSLGSPFGLRMASGRWLACDAAVVPAGGLHELDLGGEPVAVLYVEPQAGGEGRLAPLIADVEEVDGALIGRSQARAFMRGLYEDRASLGWVDAALDDLLGFAAPKSRQVMDPRVARVADAIAAAGDAPLDVAQLARGAGLSPSRLQHLFVAEVGAPMRRYRAWTRMRRAIGEIVGGATFTQAAHAAGFSDQPHFAHDFRRTFGAPASRSLTGVRG